MQHILSGKHAHGNRVFALRGSRGRQWREHNFRRARAEIDKKTDAVNNAPLMAQSNTRPDGNVST